MQTWNCVAKIPLLCTLPLRSKTVSILKKNISFGLDHVRSRHLPADSKKSSNINGQIATTSRLFLKQKRPGDSLWPFCDGENVTRTQRLFVTSNRGDRKLTTWITWGLGWRETRIELQCLHTMLGIFCIRNLHSTRNIKKGCGSWHFHRRKEKNEIQDSSRHHEKLLLRNLRK